MTAGWVSVWVYRWTWFCVSLRAEKISEKVLCDILLETTGFLSSRSHAPGEELKVTS